MCSLSLLLFSFSRVAHDRRKESGGREKVREPPDAYDTSRTVFYCGVGERASGQERDQFGIFKPPAQATSVLLLPRMSKSVRWSTVTVYEFGVAIGGSAIPKRGGPSIGLARKPSCVWSSPVDALDDSDDSDDSQASSSSSSSGDEELQSASRQSVSRRGNGNDRSKRLARKRRVRWLKPLERVTMLTDAGCSEKRIYRMMMECSEIAMSRRLCITVQRSVAV